MSVNTIYSNNYVSISADGIDLTRSRFPYKHIDYAEINDVQIKKGYLIRNRSAVMISCLLSMVLLVSYILQSGFFETLFSPEPVAAFIIVASRPVLALLVLVTALGFLFYQSFARSRVMIIKTPNKKFSVRLHELKDEQQEQSILHFLSSRIAVSPRK